MPGSTPSRSRNCYVSLIPMSERQQLKLVRQLETGDNQGGNSGSIRDSVLHRPRSRSCNGRGETPLHKAAIKGDEELVAKLLEEGADPNTPDFAGWTPLHEACNHGWYGVAQALLQAGASVNARGFDDDTPLHDAAINGHSKLVRLLLESGADVYSRNKGGKTPCDVAAPGLMPDLLRCQMPERSELGSKKPEASGRSVEADDTAISEMRRTPPQTKVEKSPRVTLRLHQIKKKSGRINTEGTGYNNSRFQLSIGMEEKSNKDDVYEFKSSKEATPIRGNSTSPDVDKSASDTKSEKPNEGNTGTEGEQAQTLKRNISDVADNDENEDDTKKKKRKEFDRENKDAGNASKTTASTGRMTAVRNVTNNADKGGKVGSHVVSKGSSTTTPKTALAATVSSGTTDRKSPSSPKGNGTPASTSTPSNGNNSVKVEPESDDKSGADGEKVDPGPKVPPLKIVIPQQSGAEPEQGNRNGKNSTSRHHQALPYVVSSNSNDSEKDGTRSRSVSPTDSVKSDDKKDPSIGMLSAEDQKGSLHHQRVLRSSHRSGPGSNGESRSSDNPPAPRSGTNGNNGQVSNTNSGTTVTVMTSSTNTTSGATTTTTTTTAATTAAATPSTDSPSPPAQSQTSPSPVAEVTAASNASAAASGENNSTSNCGNFGSFRSNTVSTAKPATAVSSSTVATTGNEEKTAETSTESGSSPVQQAAQTTAAVVLHPRKRKLKHNKDVKEPQPGQVVTERSEPAGTSSEDHPHEQPVKNCYQLFLDIRKQIDRRRKGLFPVQPKPPQGFKDYLMNRCTYVLAGNASTRQIPSSPMPQNVPQSIKELFAEQEKERHRLRLQHVIEKEKLVLSVEQEILRVHGRAARALANQSLPFSVCTILKDEEVYNLITPEQEEKDRNARSRYNGRLFLSWLQDVDDKWEKIKEAMLLRHHNEAESLHAVQKMDWEWKMKELGLCEFKSKPVILDSHVPMVHVSDDFDLLPA